MAEKNAILRRVFYDVVSQVVGKIVAFLLRKLGPATPQMGPRYLVTGAPLHLNGGRIASQRRPSCNGVEALLAYTEKIIRWFVVKISTANGFIISKSAENSCS